MTELKWILLLGVGGVISILLLFRFIDRYRCRRIARLLGFPESTLPDWKAVEGRLKDIVKQPVEVGLIAPGGEWLYLSQHVLMATLVHEITHELKQPLTVIQGYIQLLKRELNNESRFKEDLEVIEQQLGRLMVVLQRMKDYQNIPSPAHSAVELVPVDKAVEPVVHLLRPLLMRRGVELRVEFGPLGHARVESNEFQHIVWNLVTNAMEALESSPSDRKPEICIRVKHFDPIMAGLEPKTGVQCGVSFQVEDNGPGFEIDTRGALEPFRTSKEGPRRGLGLAICQRLVEQHHGRLEIYSRPGHGTRVTIFWPCSL